MASVSVAENVTKAAPFDVAAAQDRDGWSLRHDDLLEQRSDGDRTAWLDDELHSVKQDAHRVAKRRVVDENDVIEKALVVREGDRTDLHRQQPVSQAARVLELHRPPGGARARELRRACRLHADDSRRRQSLLDGRGNAGAETAAAYRNEHGVDVR